MRHTADIVRGFTWVFLMRIVARLLTFARVFVLARLLTPTQFGTFAIATLVLSLLEVLTETGTQVVLVQEKKEQFASYLNAAWFVSITRGLILCVLLFAATPFVLDFFNNPTALNSLLLIALLPLIKGFINPSVARFQKELLFKNELYMRSCIGILGTIITIVLAMLWRDPLVLAIGLIFEGVFEVIITHYYITPRPVFSFEKDKIISILQRGKWMGPATLFNYFFHQLDDIVVGRTLGSSSLGIYQMAYRIATLPITEISDSLNKVTFPVFTNLTADITTLRKTYAKTTSAIILLSIPLSAIFIIFPQQIVRLVLGEQWIETAQLLPILAIFGFLRSLLNSSSSLFLSLKRQDLVAQYTGISIVVMALCLFPLIHWYGTQGAAIAVLIGCLSTIPFVVYHVRKLLYDPAH
jgi:O-antigen/teichoic acid export membrane protein